MSTNFNENYTMFFASQLFLKNFVRKFVESHFFIENYAMFFFFCTIILIIIYVMRLLIIFDRRSTQCYYKTEQFS